MRYYEDIAVGEPRTLGSHEVTAEEITAFGRTYDPQPFHVDEARARESSYGRLIASGFHTLCLANRTVVEDFRADAAGVAGLGLDEVRWPSPVGAGDEIVVRHEVTDKRVSETRGDRGVIVEQVDVTNQRGETVLSYATPGLFERRERGE